MRRRFLFLFPLLFAVPAMGQTISATNLGGGCGATQGYPTISVGNRLQFYVQRSACPTNSWSFPTGIIVDLQPPQFALPFVSGIAPGCVIIAPTLYRPSSAVGGSGSVVFLFDLGQVPRPLTLYAQGVAACAVSGNLPTELAFSDAWQVRLP